MKKILIISVLLTVLACILFIACSDDDSSTGPENGDSYISATLVHWGFDFSEAKGGTEGKNVENSDGETIGWRSIGTWSDEGIWFRTMVYPNRTQSLGAVNIYSITAIDTTTAAWDTEPPPLSKNDVVIAQCIDGFVKFQVTADVDTSSANNFWEVKVKYLFSSTPSFSE